LWEEGSMHYSRRDFLRVATAGIPVAGMPWFFSSVARAEAPARERYAQIRADRIHKRSTEEAIREAGEDPEEVKARVKSRVRELRAGSAT
jgi:hypothetical protein